ncbi:hypothetical protein [Pseudanabaena phage PA-SR01]|nr:hypothetical protein [Pseudanabaena phage PA-SR01]
MEDYYDAQIYSLASGWFVSDSDIFIERQFIPIGFSLFFLVSLLHILVYESNLIFGEYDF